MTHSDPAYMSDRIDHFKSQLYSICDLEDMASFLLRNVDLIDERYLITEQVADKQWKSYVKLTEIKAKRMRNTVLFWMLSEDFKTKEQIYTSIFLKRLSDYGINTENNSRAFIFSFDKVKFESMIDYQRLVS